jgi:hypothetical protein
VVCLAWGWVALAEGAIVLVIGLLGPLEVSVGGRRVVLPTGRLRPLRQRIFAASRVADSCCP